MYERALKRTKKWTILNIVFYFMTLGINSLGSSGFFNDMGQKDVSDKYTTLLTPASFAFAIWGVIYGLLLMTLIYFFIKKRDEGTSKLSEKISPLFILSSIFNMGWIVSFSYEKLGISTILIIGMLISLLLILEMIYKNRRNNSYILPLISFTLYAAWVFIATILNMALLAVQKNWQGFGFSNSIRAILIIFLVIALTLIYLYIKRNAVFPISLAWGFFGIYSSYSSGILKSPMAFEIQGVLLFGIVVFLLSIIITFVKNNYSIIPRKY